MKVLTIVRGFRNMPQPGRRWRPAIMTNHYEYSMAAARYNALIKTRAYAKVTMDCYEGNKWVSGEWWERGFNEVTDRRGGASL